MSDFGAAIERAVFIVGLNAGVRKISAFSGTTIYGQLCVGRRIDARADRRGGLGDDRSIEFVVEVTDR